MVTFLTQNDLKYKNALLFLLSLTRKHELEFRNNFCASDAWIQSNKIPPQKKGKKTGSEIMWSYTCMTRLNGKTNTGFPQQPKSIDWEPSPHPLFSQTTPNETHFQHLYFVSFVAISNVSTQDRIFELITFSCTFLAFSCEQNVNW